MSRSGSSGTPYNTPTTAEHLLSSIASNTIVKLAMAASDPLQPPPRFKEWIVTGCSPGLGQQIVHTVLARGDKIIVTARRISNLEYIKDQFSNTKKAYCITLDVTAPSEQIRKAIDEAVDHFGLIDVLVNNAGFVVSAV
ncbi:hypothetical protein G6011_09700 [Alternaria panax]|uniref:Uncharacterized protein n=1 Tax=Alternaria panax TaxID=48097 RepID=A0AAD4FAR0_9PLEO|nr:hypothetical protein G6011_09700 [Alternaria panax]